MILSNHVTYIDSAHISIYVVRNVETDNTVPVITRIINDKKDLQVLEILDVISFEFLCQVVKLSILELFGRCRKDLTGKSLARLYANEVTKASRKKAQEESPPLHAEEWEYRPPPLQ